MQYLRKTVSEPLCTRRSVAGVGTEPLCLIVIMHKRSKTQISNLCALSTQPIWPFHLVCSSGFVIEIDRFSPGGGNLQCTKVLISV